MRLRALARRLALAAVAALAVSAAAGPALASTGTEEQQGAALVKAVNDGKRSCQSLSSTDFERIGEYAMGLSFATVAQHDAMNQRMRAMMGTQGEEQAHQAMGRNYSGCVASGRRSGSGSGTMGGNVYGSGTMGGSGYGPGMMGGSGRGSAGGRGARATDGGNGTSTAAVVLIAVLAAGLGAASGALIARRLARGRPAAGAS